MQTTGTPGEKTKERQKDDAVNAMLFNATLYKSMDYIPVLLFSINDEEGR